MKQTLVFSSVVKTLITAVPQISSPDEKILLTISHVSGTDEAQILNSMAIKRLFSCIWILWYINLVVMEDDGVQMQTLNSFIVLFNHQLSLLQNSISDSLWEILPM